MAVAKPLITPTDRFGLTFCLAVMAHGILVLGVTFAPEDIPPPRYETMEIILVQQKSEAAEDAKILAQENLQGGGDLADAETPATPLPAPFPQEEPEIAAPPPVETQAPAESAEANLQSQAKHKHHYGRVLNSRSKYSNRHPS